MFICMFIIAGVVFLDQLTKWLAVTFLKGIETLPLIRDVLHLTYVENEGAAFGILKDNRWIFIVVSTVAIIALLVYLWKVAPKSKLLRTGIAFIIGGGIGNMIDRTLIGYVIDFIDFRLINFAVFNTADSFVCVGAAFILIYVFFFSDKEGLTSSGTDKSHGNI